MATDDYVLIEPPKPSRLQRFDNWLATDDSTLMLTLLAFLVFTLLITILILSCSYMPSPDQVYYVSLSQQEVDNILNMSTLRKEGCKLYAEMLQMINMKYFYTVAPSNLDKFVQRVYDVCIKKSN